MTDWTTFPMQHLPPHAVVEKITHSYDDGDGVWHVLVRAGHCDFVYLRLEADGSWHVAKAENAPKQAT